MGFHRFSAPHWISQVCASQLNDTCSLCMNRLYKDMFTRFLSSFSHQTTSTDVPLVSNFLGTLQSYWRFLVSTRVILSYVLVTAEKTVHYSSAHFLWTGCHRLGFVYLRLIFPLPAIDVPLNFHRKIRRDNDQRHWQHQRSICPMPTTSLTKTEKSAENLLSV